MIRTKLRYQITLGSRKEFLEIPEVIKAKMGVKFLDVLTMEGDEENGILMVRKEADDNPEPDTSGE